MLSVRALLVVEPLGPGSSRAEGGVTGRIFSSITGSGAATLMILGVGALTGTVGFAGAGAGLAAALTGVLVTGFATGFAAGLGTALAAGFALTAGLAATAFLAATAGFLAAFFCGEGLVAMTRFSVDFHQANQG